MGSTVAYLYYAAYPTAQPLVPPLRFVCSLITLLKQILTSLPPQTCPS